MHPSPRSTQPGAAPARRLGVCSDAPFTIFITSIKGSGMRTFPVLLALLPLVAAVTASPVYASVASTDGGTLDVDFTTDPPHIRPGEEAKLKINFLNPVTQNTQIHIDYFVTVLEDGTEMFGPTNRLHTSEGKISVPVQFQRAGEYEVKIDVDGILFNPIPTETVSFSLTAGGNPPDPAPSTPGTDGDGGGCLVATAAFGSEMAEEVQMLREIRDNSLLATRSGSAFMAGFNQFYYAFSPTVADWERQNPAFKEAVRVAITPLISSLSLLDHANAGSEGEVLGYGIGIISLNLGMYVGLPLAGVLRLYQIRKKIAGFSDILERFLFARARPDTMKILTAGSSLIVLFAIAAGVNAAPSAFADHATAEVQMGIGSGVSGCQETNECYIPYEATVDVGGEVTWINDDSVAHTVTAGELTDENTGVDYPNGFDSGLFVPGTTYSHKFTEAGTYPYFCLVHPWMTGFIHVEGDSAMEPGSDMAMGDVHKGDDHGSAMQPESIDEIMATITTGDAMQNSPMSIDVAITDMDGGELEHVNFKVVAMQNGQTVLEEELHAHKGTATTQTAPLPMAASEENPVSVTVDFLGFGIDEITGPSGQLATKQVIPEFGTIAMMILGISIISIVALTAKSRVIPRI